MDKLHDCYIWHIIILAKIKLRKKELECLQKKIER